VDETDIVMLHLGQPAEVTIDAIPKKVFHGTVSEIGDNAIVRLHRLATSQQTTASEESQRFQKWWLPDRSSAGSASRPLDHCQDTTASRSSVLAIPIQALSVRTTAQLEQEKSTPGSVHAAAPMPKERHSRK